ncbi:AmpG family muropeptide MFS transporter [Candidatus Endoriftia persephone]|uniref:AmpG family muropeptide MFS transporter n=3 Tax=Gammaproteobacteria TaxID=1236 RepID=A0A9J6ZX21_9GAMM|nr:AmpG family muropeptide MFS transporter [Candidatus Endoriftia persephone]EGV52074.1 putative transporter AmpG [endosymbiont of Riftia pachyptila (vent Ph05)]EGW54387.1 putative transporter AmpG [endosymbiont of Tevnia jerichonana (vent Tica)]USF87237.1 AmpG family muropeptide MFS transporter [Candidatus Endoriftia persephone]
MPNPIHSFFIGWLEALEVYTQPRVRGMLFLGFSAGLPLLLVFGTLSFWLREAGIERSTIGFISWVALAYSLKWLWAPLVDRLPLPGLTARLGRRRSWMLLAQLTILAGLVGMALFDPREELTLFVALALLVAFASATQDIAIDAYRIESVSRDLQGAMAATYMLGYRLAMIVAGAGALAIAALFEADSSIYQQSAWSAAYLSMAGLMLVGMVTTLLISEPEVDANGETRRRESEGIELLEQQGWLPRPLRRFSEWFYAAAISPFVDFIVRYRWHALLILTLIASYRISDVVLGVISNVFYVDMGYSKAEVATITKVYGVIMTLVGAGLGGLLMVRIGVMRVLLIGGLLAAATNLLFVWLAGLGHDLGMLTLVISVDNLSGGLASAAFIAYLSSLTNVSYSATQYALFSSVMLLLPKLVGGFSGVMVDSIGYASFFITTTLMGVPVLLLILLAMRYVPAEENQHG